MNKSLIFDTGPLINLALNNLLWTLKPLKKKFNGKFYITASVKKEIVDKPLSTKRYKLEALQLLSLLEEGILEVYESPELKERALSLLKLSNSIMKARGNYIKNVQFAEIEAVVAAKMLEAEAVVIDEFITRALLENPMEVKKKMQKKFHSSISVDSKNLKKFREQIKGITVIRSVELMTIAYEYNMFEVYYPEMPDPKHILLDGLLWGLKLNGCAVTEQEIKQLQKIEGF